MITGMATDPTANWPEASTTRRRTSSIHAATSPKSSVSGCHTLPTCHVYASSGQVESRD